MVYPRAVTWTSGERINSIMEIFFLTQKALEPCQRFGLVRKSDYMCVPICVSLLCCLKPHQISWISLFAITYNRNSSSSGLSFNPAACTTTELISLSACLQALITVWKVATYFRGLLCSAPLSSWTRSAGLADLVESTADMTEL